MPAKTTKGRTGITVPPAKQAPQKANGAPLPEDIRQELDGWKTRPFVWNEQRAKAATLWATGRYTKREIATLCGIGLQALYEWYAFPEFKQRVKEEAEVLKDDLLPTGIANKAARIAAAQERWLLLAQIIQQRQEEAIQIIAAEDKRRAELEAEGQDPDNIVPIRPVGNGSPASRGRSTAAVPFVSRIVPGRETGLLVAKSVPGGMGAVDWVVDKDLLAEMRTLEKQIAEELGQMQQKVDITTGGKPIRFTIPMSDDAPVIIDGDYVESRYAQIEPGKAYRQIPDPDDPENLPALAAAQGEEVQDAK